MELKIHEFIFWLDVNTQLQSGCDAEKKTLCFSRESQTGLLITLLTDLALLMS